MTGGPGCAQCPWPVGNPTSGAGIAISIGFIIPPAQRPRVTRNGTYAPKSGKAEGAIAQLMAAEAMVQGWELSDKPMTLKVTFHRDNRRRPDIDNLLKTVMDGITKSRSIWEDDKQVVGVYAERHDKCGIDGADIVISIVGDQATQP